MKKPSKKVLGAVLFLLILGSSGGVYYYQSHRTVANVTEPATVITALKKDVKISLSADGKAVYPLTNLKFSGTGILKEILVKEGQWVKYGDVLARLDTQNLENQVKQAEANYNSALDKYQKLLVGPSNVERQAKQVVVNSAEKSLKVQQAAYDYKVTLLNDGKTTEADILAEELKLESAKAQLENANAQFALLTPTDPFDLASANETVKQMEANLAIAKNNLNEATLLAPVDGVIYAINGNVGELLSTSGTGFIALAQGNRLTVNANLIEDDIGKIQVGQLVEVNFTSMQDKTYEGKVVSISPDPIIDQSGIVTYEVAVSLNQPDDAIKNGMTATVSFIAQQAKGVVTIPVEAVVRINGAPTVEVENAEGSYQYVQVKTGLTDGRIVEIKEGLKNGDKVVIRKVSKK